MKRLFYSALAVGSLLVPAAALAQREDGVEAATVMGGAAAAGLAGMMLVFMFVVGLVALGFFIFWILMLVDCIKREWPEKNTWLILLIVSFFVGFHWLIALLYYFMIKKKDLGAMPVVAPQPPTPPAPPAPPAA